MISAAFILFCLLCVWFDCEYRMIPNILMLPAVVLCGIIGGHVWWGLFILMVGLAERYHCTLYGGDVKLIVAGSLLLGSYGALAYLLAIWTLRGFTVLKIKSKQRPTLMPFAPFYAAGVLIAFGFRYINML